jgi:intracellular multiplication protein IcmB
MSLSSFLSSLMSASDTLTKKPLSSFCFLETADGQDIIIGKDGSMASVVRIDGIQKIIGDEELESIIHDMNLKMSPYLGREGHSIQVWFCRDPDLANQMVKDLVRPSRGVAKKLGLELDDLFQAKETTLPKHVVWEGFYMVLWTRLSILTKKESENARADLVPPKMLPSFADAQDFTKVSRAIKDRHRSFVRNFVSDLKQMQLRAAVLETKDAIKVMKWSVYPDLVGADWKPSIPGTALNVRTPEFTDFDASHMLWPRLEEQIFDREGQRISPRIVQLGSKYFSGMDMVIGPQETQSFGHLLNRMLEDEFPWRISFMLEGGGLRSMDIKAFLASIFQITNSDNRQIHEAIKALKAERQSGTTITKFRVSFATWADVGENGIRTIEERSARLQRSVEAWGYCHVSPLVGDPMAGVMSTTLGLDVGSTAPAGAVPLPDVIAMLPWNRDASPWRHGSVLFRTPDGRPWPYHPGSSLQDTFIDLIFAPPGKGKSVLMNTINLALCLSPSSTTGTGGAQLPRIAIIDIGPSSHGLISVLQEALPPSRKHEVAYKRLRMDHEHSINPCDTQLGCRKLLPLEKSFLLNFLTTLGTEPGAERAPEGLAGILSVAIDAVYEKNSDRSRKGSPKRYNVKVSRAVDRAINNYGIAYQPGVTSWWEIVDELFKRGDTHTAMLAQRHAVPRMEDFQAILFDEQVTDIHGSAKTMTGEKVVEVAARVINSALREYPILQRPTNFDIGEARVVALDLDEVAPKGGGPADKQTALMYMLARFVLARDYYLNPDIIADIPEDYRSYHIPRIRRIKETPKRIVYDEFHRTSNSEAVRAQVMIDMREGRKFGVHICLASQMLEDFDKNMIDMATGHWILGVGTERAVQETQRQFGLNETSTSIVRTRLNGPREDGAPFLVVLKLKEGHHEHMLINTLGPTEIWAFSTTAEDVALRNRLYDLLGAVEARRRLSIRFKSGSAKSEVERRVAVLMEHGAKSEDDAESGIIEELVQEIASMKI